MKIYGVLLIGCGHIGEEHIQDIYFRDNIKIVAVVDYDIERANLFKRKYNATYSGKDYREFLYMDEVDIVIIATYVNTHLSILKDCLAHSKHILCEKPIAKTLKEGKEFCELVKASNSKVLVAHILRHNETYQRVKEYIDSGMIGSLKLMRMVQNHNAKEWDRYKNLLEDCSPIIDCGVHYIDVAQWFTSSKVYEVSGSGSTLDVDSPNEYNHGIISMKLENGANAVYEAGWSKNLESKNIKEFIGDKGRISITLQWLREENKEEGDLVSIYLSESEKYISVNIQSKYKNMYAQVEALIAMIENDSEACPTMEEVYSAFKVALAADFAIINNKIVEIKSFE